MSIVLMSKKKFKLKKKNIQLTLAIFCGPLSQRSLSPYSWDFVQALESTFTLSFKTPAASIDFILPYDQPIRNKKY